MATISENLLELKQAKANIKTAIEGKGQDLTGVPFTQYSEKISAITTGADSTDKYKVTVYDYDGTILQEKMLNDGDVFTLPEPPTHHDRLVFQEWTSPKVITDNTITINGDDVHIGAVYTTASGLSEFDIELTKATGLTATLNMNGTKDWGDGTSDTETTHTYADYGEYTIKCDGTTITASSSASIMGAGDNYSLKQAFLVYSGSFPHYCFNRCKSLEFITLSVQTNVDYNYIFGNCVNLKCVVIPKPAKGLNIGTFSACYSLFAVVLSLNCTTIQQYSFTNCYSLSSVVLPDSKVSIVNGYSFQNCYSLKKIRIKQCDSIASNTFENCYSLETVELPEGLKTLYSSVLYNCYSLKDFKFPTTVTTIQGRGLYYSVNIESIEIPDGVQVIPSFQYCKNLRRVKLPESATTIATSGFGHCENLKEINIPNNVQTLNAGTFYNDFNLENIKLPAGITTIKSTVFIGCSGVKIFDFSSVLSIPTLENINAFNYINHNCKIVVPDALYDEWIVATNWANYADYIYKASEVEL